MKKVKDKEKMKRIAMQLSVNIAVIAIILLVANISILVYPKEGMHTGTTKVNFEWVGLSDVKVDDNPSFVSPVVVQKNNPIAELKPGVYYWKSGLSRVHSFVIDSEVTVSVTEGAIENETKYRIENKGNTRILLRLIGMITGQTILEPDAVMYQDNISEIEKIEVQEK